MAKFMAKILVAKGKKPHQKAGGIGEILEVSIGDELDKVLARRLVEAVQLRAVEVSADRFEAYLQMLSEYRSIHGHANVPRGYIVKEFGLGTWLHDQRNLFRNGGLDASKVDALTRLGVVFNRLEEWRDQQWDEGIDALQKFRKREGHLDVPALHSESGYKLGHWVNNVRTKRNKGVMDDAQVAELDALGFIWAVREKDFARAMVVLGEYVQKNNHTNVPQGYSLKGFKLGLWLSTKRASMRKGTLPKNEGLALTRAGVVWEPNESAWSEKFEALKAFKKKHGRFPIGLRGPDEEAALVRWMGNKRQERGQGRLPKERVLALEKIGFSWNTKDEAWQENVALLKAFKSREGNCVVPVAYVENGVKLGTWLSNVRGKAARGNLPREKRAELLKLGVKLPSAGSKGKRHGPNQLK
jgi:hypothetical protein